MLLGGAVSSQQSVLSLFNYEDENLKKSTGVNRRIDGRLTQLLVGENNNQELALIATEHDSQHQIMKVNKDAFAREGEELCSVVHSQKDPIHSMALKPDLTELFLAGGKDISVFDLEKGAVSASFAHNSGNLENLAIDPNFEMVSYVC